MENILPIVMLIVGLVFGGVAAWLLVRTRIEQAARLARSEAEAEIAALRANLENRDNTIEQQRADLNQRKSEIGEARRAISGLEKQLAQWKTQLEQERKRTAEQEALLNEAKDKLADAFKALSSDALKSNNESFLKLAKETLGQFQATAKGDLEKRQQAIDSLVKPIEKSLKQVDDKLQSIEQQRVKAYSSLRENIQALAESNRVLRKETSHLVTALRKPDVRGRWGEIQLKRVVEMAGMVEHCDFFQQQSVTTGDGRLRPDMLVRLPGGKTIVVDSKVPLTAFLKANEAPDEESRKACLRDHARHVKNHIQDLGKKSYFAQFDQAPEFVVLFLPGEIFFSAALEQNPELIEMGVEQNVIIATPTTLIALLKAVAYGWTQERLAENAREISGLGKELYKRLSQLGTHLSKLGKSLAGATKAYNAAIGSIEGRVMVTARKFDDLHITVAGSELEPLTQVDQTPRALQAPELVEDPADDSAEADSPGSG